MSIEEEFQQRLAAIEAREREVTRREAAASAKGLRRNLYERITISKRALDIIIVVCLALIAVCVAAGIVIGNGK